MSKDLMKYMKKVDNSLVFNGKTMIVKIPLKYEEKKMMELSNNITTVAIFEMNIDGERIGLHLPSFIEMEYDDVTKITENGVAYYLVTLNKGAKFVVNTTLLKYGDVPYKVFREFVDLGYMPDFFDYDSRAILFDDFKKYCGFKLDVSHVVLEFIIAHLSRDQSDLSVKYRYTDMKKPSRFIGLSNIEFATDGTTSKIVGANFTKGMNAALTQQNEQRYELEDLLRS